MYKCIYLKYKIMLSWALPCNRDLTADCTIYLSLLCLPLTPERKLQSYKTDTKPSVSYHMYPANQFEVIRSKVTTKAV